VVESEDKEVFEHIDEDEEFLTRLLLEFLDTLPFGGLGLVLPIEDAFFDMMSGTFGDDEGDDCFILEELAFG
jgi:hypothetical protein